MTADAAIGEDHQPYRARRRWQVALAVLLIVLVVVAAVWSQRRAIAEDFVDRELERRGVQASYTVADIGFARQRLTDVVIGDPRRPDLVADRIDVATEIGLGGPRLTGVFARHVRMRARLVDGALSLGAIDKLMPPPSGKPFQLPAINVDVRDLRMRLETPQGIVGIRASGGGRLNDGFKGRLAAVAERLNVGGCTVARFAAATSLRVTAEQPSIEGPLRAADARCGGARASGIAADVVATFAPALDRWTGRVRLAAAIASEELQARQVIGRLSFSGSAAATTGTVDLDIGNAATQLAHVQAASIAGRYRLGRDMSAFNGRVGVERAALAPAMRAHLAPLRTMGSGTPIGPLAARIAAAAHAAAGNLSGEAAIEAVTLGSGYAVRVTQLSLASASGATMRLSGNRLRFGTVELGGRLALSGGGLPQARIDLRREAGALIGVATVAPYQAGNARLSLAPVTFRAGENGTTLLDTVVDVSGPLGDGRIDGARMPIAARWADGHLAVNRRCVPLAWRRVAVAGLALAPAQLRLCPLGDALLSLDDGVLRGGARIATPRLDGMLGGTPLRLAATDAELRLADTGFALRDLTATLGAPGKVTRLQVAQLSGSATGDAVGGRFAGAGGQIANVPLVLADAAGDWRLSQGVLKLGGRLQLTDAAIEPRLRPLVSNDVALTLADGRIDAAGTLRSPKTNAEIAAVRIAHTLASGSGRASLAVANVRFASEGLQPDDLTPLTFGVIADVNGTIAGRGDIAWDAKGVTSTGRFATKDLDLAAAFGPVSDIAGEVVFTDLLGLVSAPGQVATIGQVNPGIAVENGTVRYQLVGNNRVAVTGGQWPFAGGELMLEPTLLDFNEKQQRRMTFRVTAVDAAQFLQQFDFDNLNATGTFDGVLPMVFDDAGGRIADGRLAARGGGNIAYVGALSDKELGTWGNIAFQALKSLDYRDLDITLNGPLAGEMVSEIRFAGVSQGKGTKSNVLIRRIAKLPFVFNVTVRAPFRQLVDTVRSYYDPARLIQRNLPALIEQQQRRAVPAPPSPDTSPANRPAAFPPAVQPSESEKQP